MTTFEQQIRNAINGRHPLVYLHTPEEDRVIAALRRLAGAPRERNYTVRVWSCVTGFSEMPDADDTRDPVTALGAVTAASEPGFYVMKDLSAFLDRAAVVRALRNVYFELNGGGGKHVVIVSPELVVPGLLEKELCLVDVEPPDLDELRQKVLAVQSEYGGAGLPPDLHGEISLALKGLTLNEVGHIMHRVFQDGRLAEKDILAQIFAEKEMIVRKSGFLEFIPPRHDISQIGGLDVLKDWLSKRRTVFNQDTVDAGIPVPKGILLMGVSGCGKSLCAKVVSTLWRVPLFRLDMNLVFSGLYGSAEAAFHHALRTVEAVSPAVLWIDEIENGLGISESKDSSQQHIFSAFLTWMQEKPPLVFVAATANQIHLLPAEIIRKGRFDQVFFCDLPSEAERGKIIEIHLRRNGGEPADFDLSYLIAATDGWNGAEIEQAIISARIDAYDDGQRPFRTADVSRHTRTMVPISETMAEQIKALRNWAWGRATPASKTKGSRRN